MQPALSAKTRRRVFGSGSPAGGSGIAHSPEPPGYPSSAIPARLPRTAAGSRPTEAGGGMPMAGGPGLAGSRRR